MVDSNQPLIINKAKVYARSASHAYDELHSFRTWLKWMCVDQSNATRKFVSWFIFLLFGIIIPCLSHFILGCNDCEHKHTRPYDSVIQLSLSSVATLSFVCLSQFVRKYGLRRFLFFDKLVHESEAVRTCYTEQLHRSQTLLFSFVCPCFIAQSVYKIWWFASVGTKLPFLGNEILSDSIVCALELISWLYRTVVFFLVCVLFRLICYLQILRLQDFAKVFHGDSDVESILKEHLRIKRHLSIISHRYRQFILWTLILITASQFTCLLMITRPHADVSIYKTGEMVLCSVSLIAGVLILLRSATRITHKAHAVTCLAAKWHVCATIDYEEPTESETPTNRSEIRTNGDQVFPILSDDSEDDVGDEEDELHNSKFVPSYAYSTISFQKRQALVTYFENNRAGVTLYGIMLDRASLNAIFGLELSFVLWLLGKTVTIS